MLKRVRLRVNTEQTSVLLVKGYDYNFLFFLANAPPLKLEERRVIKTFVFQLKDLFKIPATLDMSAKAIAADGQAKAKGCVKSCLAKTHNLMCSGWETIKMEVKNPNNKKIAIHGGIFAAAVYVFARYSHFFSV